MTTPLPRPERADARLNRERIIEAARQLFLEHGTAVEMRQVAERAGVGVGTIYRNFPAKSDLVFAVANDLIDEADRALDRILALENPIEVVASYVRTLAQTFSRTLPLAMDIMAANQFDSISARVVRWIQEPRLEAIIAAAIQQGLFRSDLDPAIARTFVACVANPILAKSTEPGPLPPNVLDGLIELVLRALLAPGVPIPACVSQKGT